MDFSLLDLLFPKRCVGCLRFGLYLCNKCRDSQELHNPQVCPECERPAVDGQTHPVCRRPLGLDGLVAIFTYTPPVESVIKHLKYRFAQDISDVLVLWSCSELVKQEIILEHPIIVPIPLYTLRQNWRGFNQAELLGKDIAKRMDWGYDNLLLRTKSRKPQTEVRKAEKRSLNVGGIFIINQRIDQLTDQPFILFDDVWTTGSTMKEAASVLKRARAKKVWGLIIAR